MGVKSINLNYIQIRVGKFYEVALYDDLVEPKSCSSYK